MKKQLFILISLTASSFCYSQTILFQCSFDGPGNTPSQVVANCSGNGGSMDNSSMIVTGGYDGGKSLRYYYPNTGNEVIDAFSTPTFNKQELTVVYWEKFSVDPKSSSTIWNVKSIRPYVGPNSSDYMAAIMSLHNGGAWYQSTWATGGNTTLTTTSKANNVVIDPSAYCTGSGNNFTCNNGRLELSWTPGWGTSWHKVRIYMKVPSNSSTADGITKVWIDENLIYTLSNYKGKSTWYPYTTYITFHPSDDFFQGISGNKMSFYHFYDDITVYNGYVPAVSTEIETPVETNPDFNIFPNPFTESATIDFTGIKKSSGDNLNFYLYNLLGEEVATYTISTDKFILERNNLDNGVYLYKVMLNEKYIGSGKLIIQ